MSSSPHIIDVTDALFEQQVVEASRQAPVVVDFWAPWCGPCRALGPVLERLAIEADGAWVLAKVNTDEHKDHAAQLGVRGIPAVKAFRGGELIAEFTGALPEEHIRRWLEDVVPSSGRLAAEQAASLLLAGDHQQADELATSVLQGEPRQALALLVRAKAALTDARPEDATAFLDRIGDARELSGDVERTRAGAVLAAAAQAAGDEPELRQRLEADPADAQADAGIAAYEALAGDPGGAFGRLCALIGSQPSAKKLAHPLALAVLELSPADAQPEMRKKLSMVLF